MFEMRALQSFGSTLDSLIVRFPYINILTLYCMYTHIIALIPFNLFNIKYNSTIQVLDSKKYFLHFIWPAIIKKKERFKCFIRDKT